MRIKRVFTVLMMTSALVAAPGIGAWAQQASSSADKMSLSSEAMPFNVTTHLHAMQEMPVVSHNGESLGKFYDVVVDFSNKRVIYALVDRDGGSLYPIPIDAIKIVDQNAMDAPAATTDSTPSATTETETAEQASDQSTAQVTEQSLTEQPAEDSETAAQQGDVTVAADATSESAPAADDNTASTAATDTDTTASDTTAADSSTIDSTAAEGSTTETTVTDSNVTEGDVALADPDAASLRLSEITVGDLVGLEVRSINDEEIADVEDVIIAEGDQAAVVVGVGGFLGIGEKWVGIPLDAFELSPDGDYVIVAVTEEELEAAPELEYDDSRSLPAETPLAEFVIDDQMQSQSTQAAATTAADSTQADMSSSENAETDSATETAANAETETAANADSETAANAETETSASAGSGTETETETAASSEAEPSSTAASDEMAQASTSESGTDSQTSAESSQDSTEDTTLAAATSDSQSLQTTTGMQDQEINSLEGKVLVVSIDADRLEQAPSYDRESFPEVADSEWQKTVLAFYQDLLDEAEPATPAASSTDEQTDTSGEASQTEANQ